MFPLCTITADFTTNQPLHPSRFHSTSLSKRSHTLYLSLSPFCSFVATLWFFFESFMVIYDFDLLALQELCSQRRQEQDLISLAGAGVLVAPQLKIWRLRVSYLFILSLSVIAFATVTNSLLQGFYMTHLMILKTIRHESLCNTILEIIGLLI
ncbi:uncharacterized protein LOC130783357 [Actinidia eriantha]|uniref:uncharacterized protein LOC130783357 n=1 Tax=Actinidia eriantha TaxID=165200 RepID=UPI0025826FDB|nr:uncharacterized protein LOC130783357 [Actinidia eriantha]